METLSITESEKTLTAALAAAQRGPVVLQESEKDIAALISMNEYEEFRQWRIKSLIQAHNQIGAEANARGLTEEKLAELMADVS